MVESIKKDKKGKQAVLSDFLFDFAPRQIADEDVEVFVFDNPFNMNEEKSVKESVVKPLKDEENNSDKEFVEAVQVKEEFDEELYKKPEEPVVEIDVEGIKKHAAEESAYQTKAALEEKFFSEMAKLNETHRTEMETLRENIVNELASNLMTEIKKSFVTVSDRLSYDVAKILSVFIGQKLSDNAVKEFAEKVAKLSLSATEPMIIEGNKILLEALSKQQNFPEDKFKLNATESSEIKILFGDMAIATRLGPLLEELRELTK